MERGESQGFLDVLKRMENCHQPTRFARDPLPFLRRLQLWQHFLGCKIPRRETSYGNGAMPMRRSTSIIYHGWLREDATSIDTISQEQSDQSESTLYSC